MNFLNITYYCRFFRSTGLRAVWRGVPENISHLYNRGDEKAWWSFSSCTSACSVLESPQYLGKKGSRTLFSIETSSGKRIQEHSYFEREEEILLPPGTYFEVIDKVNPAEGLYIIHLREKEPPYQLLVPPFDLTDSKNALPPSKPGKTKTYDINICQTLTKAFIN